MSDLPKGIKSIDKESNETVGIKDVKVPDNNIIRLYKVVSGFMIAAVLLAASSTIIFEIILVK